MPSRFRVELVWRYKRKAGGVQLGMFLEATSAQDAIDQAKAQHIKRHPSRRLVRAVAWLATDAD